MEVYSLPAAGVSYGLTRLDGEIWNLWPGWSAAHAVEIWAAEPVSTTAKAAKTRPVLVIRPSSNPWR